MLVTCLILIGLKDNCVESYPFNSCRDSCSFLEPFQSDKLLVIISFLFQDIGIPCFDDITNLLLRKIVVMTS